MVTLVKHVFEKHLVLQFNVTSTMPDQLLKVDCVCGGVGSLRADSQPRRTCACRWTLR